jgi:hypothetical protein
LTKTILKASSVALLATALFTGCAPQAQQQAAKPDFGCKQNGQPAPEWTCMPYMEGAVVALGVAQKNAGNDIAMQRAEAMSEGRDALATQISTKVSTMMKSFKETTGAGATATFDKAVSKVSKQVASQTLSGSKGMKFWQDDAGTMYILVGMSTEPVKSAVEGAVKSSFKDDKAMYQKFLNAKAQGELDNELEKAGM